MESEPSCPQCGANLSQDPLGDRLCPHCLLGLCMQVATDDGSGEAESLDPPARIGHFLIVSELGEGGAGRVFLAEDLDIPGRRVALKLLKPAGLSSGIDSLRNEAAALAALQHPNVLVVHEIGIESGQPYLATELVSGGSLAAVLMQGPLPVEAALRHGAAVAEALAAAHGRGIVHRDVKPANMLLTDDDQVRVADFGLAGAGRDALAGTPGYIAPEVLQGGAPSGLADQFSFGVMLHEMLVGRRPFEDAEWPRAILEDRPCIEQSIPRDLARIVRRCLIRDPARRHAGMDAVAVELRRAAVRRDPRRRRANWAVGAATLALIGVIALWLGLGRYHRFRARELNESGIVALQEGRRLDALRAFVAAHRSDPQLPSACVNLGELAGEEMALAYLRECASSFPDSAPILYNLGAALAANGRPDEARPVLLRALESNETDALIPPLVNELALVLVELDQPDRAIEQLSQVEFPAADTVEGALLRKTMGLAMLEAGRARDATGFFEQATRGPLGSTARGVTLVGWGRALEQIGDLPGARRLYGEALLGSNDAETTEAARSGLARIQDELTEETP